MPLLSAHNPSDLNDSQTESSKILSHVGSLAKFVMGLCAFSMRKKGEGVRTDTDYDQLWPQFYATLYFLENIS